jgi:Rrf2 family protein
MLSLTRKTDYALIALTRLATQADAERLDATDALAPLSQPGQPGQPGGPISAREIAEQFDLPLPLTMNVLKRLHRAGMIESTRGVRGGYCLSRDPRQVKLTDVIEAIEGPVRVAVCCDDAGGDHDARDGDGDCACAIRGTCPIMHAVRQLNEEIFQFIAGYTLADLVRIGSRNGASAGGGWVASKHVGRPMAAPASGANE